jgi:hypothetical protein
MGLVNACWDFESSLELDKFFQHILWCILCPCWLWSTHVEMHFIFLLAWVVFLNYLRCILWPQWHGWGLVKTCWDAFLSSTRVKINFMFTLAYESLVNQCWNAFYLFPGIGWDSSTKVEIHFVSSHWMPRFRCFLCRSLT